MGKILFLASLGFAAIRYISWLNKKPKDRLSGVQRTAKGPKELSEGETVLQAKNEAGPQGEF